MKVINKQCATKNLRQFSASLQLYLTAENLWIQELFFSELLSKFSKSYFYTFKMLLRALLLLASIVWISVLSAEIGHYRNAEQGLTEEQRALGWRQKRFIVQFQMPSPVGHFRVSMLPPFIHQMMSKIPGMIRRSFLFGGNKEPLATVPVQDEDTTTVSAESGVHYQRLYY